MLQWAVSKLENAYGKNYDPSSMREAKNHVTDLLDEDHPDNKPRSVRRDLQQAQEKVREQKPERGQQAPHNKRGIDWER